MSPPSIPSRLLCQAVLLVAAVSACAGDEPRVEAVSDSVPAVSDATADCGVSPDDVQIEQGLGVLQVGATVAPLVEQCRVIHDTVVTGSEGIPGRRLSVVILGDTVVAEVEPGSVWRIRLTTDRFRTRDS
ncbi:MAG TPA: hypothetical protein VMM77_03235, partial [Gemmatimonadaceae bacterium]|nr:hypothetical protein [Gemmatimonadaceae bacterium]